MKIRFQGPDNQSREVELTGLPVSVGRSRANTVVLEHPTVSRTHCLFDLDPFGKVTIKDLQSRYGTIVNGTRINDVVTLSPGDVVRIGEWSASIFDETLPPGDKKPNSVQAETRKLARRTAETTRKTRSLNVTVQQRYSTKYMILLVSLAATGVLLLVFALTRLFE